MCLRKILICISSLLKSPKRLFLISFLIVCCTIFYLFLLQNSFLTTNKSIVNLLRIEPTGPKTFVYDSQLDQLIKFPNEEEDSISSKYYNKSIDRKLILFWTAKYGQYSLKDWNVHTKTLDGCDYKCDFTIDQNLAAKADAIVFHPAIDMNLRNSIPSQRSPNQVYVMYWYESPHYTLLNLKNYANFFNWTLTYRRDSDIYFPYGGFTKLKEKLEKIPEHYIKKKSRLIAWLVSSCTSINHREDLVQELSSKYNLQIDIYGACGKLQCPTTANKSIDCMEWLGSQYKFYLAFENSLCKDYVTEKFFNPFKYGMIPIFFGGNGVEFLAPQSTKSFINVRNFSSPSKLVDYIKYLDTHDNEYKSYFEWTKEYKVGLQLNEHCELCRKLNSQSNNNLPHKSIPNLDEWWNIKDEFGQPICLENPSYMDKLKAFMDYIL